MATFWMHNSLTQNTEPITPTMLIYISSFPVKCYPALIGTKYKYNGDIQDTGSKSAKQMIVKKGKNIECSFHLTRNGEQWIYYNSK